MWHPKLGDPPSWSPPSPLCFLCTLPWAQWLNPGTGQHLHYPSKTSTSAYNVPGPPSYFSRLVSHPRPFPLAPAWPLVDLSMCPSAGSSLPHEYRQGRACGGLDANRRQRICNPPIPCIVWLDLPPLWLRIERGTDVHSHAHVKPVHIVVCMHV